jgi:UDP-GlcNAc:undecaprenyl-phosphate GlcNAc-1-phosphate transferase
VDNRIVNAFNIIDIMDGLSCGIAAIAAFFFFFIALPSEMLYVIFSAIALRSMSGFFCLIICQKKEKFSWETPQFGR